MRFSMCNEFCQGWEIERVFDLAVKNGYDGVEIAPFTLADDVRQINQEEREKIVAAAKARDLQIVGLHWLLVKPEGLYINHPDDALRAKTVEYVNALSEFCGDLGGKIMVFGSPKQRNLQDGWSPEETWQRTVDAFRACMPAAEKAGVTICIEPLARTETNFLNTAEDGMRLVEAVDHPNFQLMVDVKAMSDEPRPYAEIIKNVGKYVKHVHANDANLRGPGFGDVDYAPIVAALRDIRFDGFVSVEVFDFSPDPETIASKSMEYLKRVFGEE